MAKFTDKKGREWLVELDVRAFEDVLKTTGVDLQQVVNEIARFDDRGAQLGALMGDALRVVRVLAVLCEQQAANKAPAVTAEDFGRGFGGDALEDACAALLDELVSFTPRHPRQILRAGLAKSRAERDQATEQVLAALASAGPTSGAPSAPATSAAGSSDSTPAPPG